MIPSIGGRGISWIISFNIGFPYGNRHGDCLFAGQEALGGAVEIGNGVYYGARFRNQQDPEDRRQCIVLAQSGVPASLEREGKSILDHRPRMASLKKQGELSGQAHSRRALEESNEAMEH